MTLPLKAVERLFEKLQLSYGTEFTNKWGNLNSSDVKTNWAHELASFGDNLTAIGWALNHLPDRCPNVIEFKNLCKQAPKPDYKHLESPKAPAEVVDGEILKIVAGLVAPQKDKDYKGWAKRLKARDEAGEALSTHQIWSYKTALGLLDAKH